jgi:hypothetical protein
MGLKYDVTLMIVGGLIRAADMISDLYYVTTTEFDNKNLYYACWATIFITPAILFCVAIYDTIKDLVSRRYLKSLKTFGLGLLFTVIDPIGFTLIIAAFVVSCTKSTQEDRTYIEMVSKLTGFLEAMTESVPQLVIQFSNNLRVGGQWNIIAAISISLSIISISYNFLRLIYLCDKYKQLEDKHEIERLEQQEISRIIKEENNRDFTFNRIDLSISMNNIEKTVKDVTASEEETPSKVMFKSSSGSLELKRKPKSFSESRMRFNRVTPSLEIIP